MTESETLKELKSNVFGIFESKNIGETITKGISDTFDGLITAAEAREKPKPEPVKVESAKHIPINITVKPKK